MRAKANRVLPRKCTGHSKHPLQGPTAPGIRKVLTATCSEVGAGPQRGRLPRVEQYAWAGSTQNTPSTEGTASTDSRAGTWCREPTPGAGSPHPARAQVARPHLCPARSSGDSGWKRTSCCSWRVTTGCPGSGPLSWQHSQPRGRGLPVTRQDARGSRDFLN